MRKTIIRKLRAITATALILSVSAVPFARKQTVGAAQTGYVAKKASVLEQALITYDFEEGTDSLKLEGEEKLLLKDSGKKDDLGNAIMLPVINESGDEYMKVSSEALPEVVEDDGKGNVLRFMDSEKVDKYVKQTSDALDDKYKIGDYLQQEEMVGGRVHLENPYKGMTFSDTDGVTISYWVKVPEVLCTEDPATNNKGGKLIGANSTTVVFNNESRYVMQKEDYLKHLVCLAYDVFEANALLDSVELIPGAPETAVKREDYSLGTQGLVTDSAGETYILYWNYGKLVRFNPNYPLQTIEVKGETVTPTKAGGWYMPAPDNVADGKIMVTDTQGMPCNIASLATGTQIDSSQYELFRYLYAEQDDFAIGYSSASKIRDGYIKGSLQISTDNDFGFCEDDYRTESNMDAYGNIINCVVDGTKVSNPNSDMYGQYQNFRLSNQFFFDGDEFVTQGKEEDVIYDDEVEALISRPAIMGVDTWHYVTVVIKNDCVQTYVDGVAADMYEASDYSYLKDNRAVIDHIFGGKDKNAGQCFNRGKGLSGIYQFPQNNISDWSSNGTASSTPSNAVAITMLEWLTDENTELYLGGTGLCSALLSQSYGTVEGVCLDDVSFWGRVLNKQEVIQLYDEVKEDVSIILPDDADGDVSTILPDDANGDGKDDDVIGDKQKLLVELEAGAAGSRECICSVVADNVILQSLQCSVVFDETKLKFKSIQENYMSLTGGTAICNTTNNGEVIFAGAANYSQVCSGNVFTVTFEVLDKSMKQAEVVLEVDRLSDGIYGHNPYAVKASVNLDSNKEITTNPDGSVTEKVTETTVATDGAVSEKVSEITTGKDGNITSETVTETTVNPDGSLEKQIQSLQKQIDALLKILEQIIQYAEDVYNRYAVTEKESLADGTTTVKEVSESAVKDEAGNVIKTAEVVDTKKNADGVSVEKYEYTTETLPEDVEWNTSKIEELSQEEKSNLDKRGAGNNIEVYDINPYSEGTKVEPQQGSVKVSLHVGSKDWDKKKVKIFDLEHDRWLDAYFEGDFIAFEAQHFSQYAIVQLDNVKKGDADLSGDITVSDAQTALRAALNIKPLAGPDKTAADVDGDDKISLADAEKILKAAMHIEVLQ